MLEKYNNGSELKTPSIKHNPLIRIFSMLLLILGIIIPISIMVVKTTFAATLTTNANHKITAIVKQGSNGTITSLKAVWYKDDTNWTKYGEFSVNTSYPTTAYTPAGWSWSASQSGSGESAQWTYTFAGNVNKYTPYVSAAVTPNTGYHFDKWSITESSNENVTYKHDWFYFNSTKYYSFDLGSYKGNWQQFDSDYRVQHASELYRTADSTITVTPIFAPNTYTVSYELNDGTAGTNAPTSATYNSSFSVSNPTRDGYTFTGWTISGMDSCTHTYGSSTTTDNSISSTTSTSFKNLRSSSGTVTFKANWAESTGKVEFKAGDSHVKSVTWNGTSYSNLSLKDGAVQTYTGTVGTTLNASYATDTGYSFDYTTVSDRSGETFKGNPGSWDVKSGTRTVTIYSTPNTYTLKYDANGGTGAPANQTFKFDSGDKISSTKPTRAGYTFVNWKASHCNSYFNPGDAIPDGWGDFTLVAQWEQTDYTLTIDPNGGTMYYISSSNAPVSTTSSKDFTFTYNTSLTFATKSSDYHSLYGTSVYLSQPTKTGYTFTGWKVTTPSSGGGSVIDGPSASGAYGTNGTYAYNGDYAGNVTVTAQWTPSKYTLTIDPNGGTMRNGSSKTTSSFTTGFIYGRKTYMGNLTSDSSYYPNNTPTRTGYTFTGWTFSHGSGGLNSSGNSFYFSDNASSGSATNTNTYIFNGDYAGNVTATAQWTANTYTVKYNSNKPSTASGSISGTMSDSSHTYDVAKNLTANAYTLIGWTFSGWNTKADGTGTAYANKASVKNLTATNNGSVTLYAQWTANTYTVKYNGNGATGGSMANSTFTYDVSANLRDLGYTKTGYTFMGWATSASGTVKYANKASVKNLSSTNGATVTLYAVWKDITPPAFSNTDGITISPSSWTNGNAVVTSEATDSGSGMNIVTIYKSDGTQVATGISKATYTQTAEGVVTYYATAKDKAGNISTSVNKTAYVDKSAPTLNIAANPSGWTKGSVAISVTATDTLSGVNKIELYNGSGTLVKTVYGSASTSTLTLEYTDTTEGTEKYTAKSFDNVTNTSSINVTTYIDKTKPEAVITTPEGGNIKLNDNTNSTEEITYDWTNKDVTFKVTTSDGYVRTTVNASYATDTGYL